ncbi:MAG: energy-coupling factor transporter transmembrane component T [Eubacteriales bacterium]
MLKNITLGQFFPGDSVIHRMDPRTKLILVFAFVVGIFLVKSFWGYLLVGIYILLIIGISKIPLKFMLRGLKPIFIIVIFTLVLNILMTPGESLLLQWGKLKIYKEGIRTGFYFAVRLILLVLGSQILTLTTSPLALTDGLESLFKPMQKIGMPVHELAMMMTIALRFIPTLLSETDKIMKAQMSRGADFESGNLISRAKSLVPVMVPLFISAFRRADDLALAMEARCYRGGVGRTRMKKLTLTKADLLATIVFIIFVGTIAAAEILVV